MNIAGLHVATPTSWEPITGVGFLAVLLVLVLTLLLKLPLGRAKSVRVRLGPWRLFGLFEPSKPIKRARQARGGGAGPAAKRPKRVGLLSPKDKKDDRHRARGGTPRGLSNSRPRGGKASKR